MKALSLGLVKGSIDQVDKKVHMTWVQPRVLDRNQVYPHKYPKSPFIVLFELLYWCEEFVVCYFLVGGGMLKGVENFLTGGGKFT